MIVHVPPPRDGQSIRKCANALGLLEEATASPDVAVAPIAEIGSPTALPARRRNDRLAAFAIVTFRGIGRGIEVHVTACDPVKVQFRRAGESHVIPLTVQFPVATTVTGQPQLAVGETLKSAPRYVLFAAQKHDRLRVVDCEHHAAGDGTEPEDQRRCGRDRPRPREHGVGKPAGSTVATQGADQVHSTDAVRLAAVRSGVEHVM